MAVPVVASFTSNASVGNSDLLTLTTPASVAVGDTGLILVGSDQNTSVAQWDDATLKPPGFTFIKTVGTVGTLAHCAAFWRIADGTEGATIDVPSAAGADYFGWYLRVTGAHATAPIDVVGAETLTTADSLTHAIAGTTTTVADCLAFYLLSFDGGDGDPFSVAGTGWSQSAEIESGTGGANASGCWGTRAMTSAGATGTATVTSSSADSSGAFQFAIAPAAGGGAAPFIKLAGSGGLVGPGGLAGAEGGLAG